MVTVLKEKGIFAGVNLFSKQDTMDITDMFKIPLFKNFTLKMREEFLDKLEYTVEEHHTSFIKKTWGEQKTDFI